MRSSLAFLLSGLMATAAWTLPAAADTLLSGTIKSAAGEAMGGVTVSAKADGGSITTTVFTDEAGNYYFPPLPNGKYRVWAQAVSFATAKSSIDLKSPHHQDFTLKPMKDYVRQLPGDVLIGALPDKTPEDARLKRIVHSACTSCHTPSYILQHKFDEAGWSKIIELMKNVNVSGIYQGEKSKPNAILDFHQKELAAYLARARGPGQSAMNIKLRPRPTGEAARVVFKEYDVPIDRELGLEKTAINDGSDWSMGAPSRSGSIVHDAWTDGDGHLWYTSNTPNHSTTIGKIDQKTGATRTFKLDREKGLAANTHGMVRDPEGVIWFNITTTKGGLARLDPKTDKIDVYLPPEGMSPTGGAVTVDYDGQGKIWVSAPDGALRFDPDTKTFTEFKSVEFKTPHGTGITYGVAADRDGNGWWAQMGLDLVGKSDIATGKSIEIKMPPVQSAMANITPAEKTLYDSYSQLDFNNPYPWSQGPRRMGADKNADVVWVCNFYGGSFARIDTKTLDVKIVPLPNSETQYPYHAQIDKQHRVWTNMMNADQVLRYDPAKNEFAYFDLPGRGTEPRYISFLERDGQTQVVVPYSRTSKVAVMTFRSEADMAKAKQAAAKKPAGKQTAAAR